LVIDATIGGFIVQRNAATVSYDTDLGGRVGENFKPGDTLQVPVPDAGVSVLLLAILSGAAGTHQDRL
jgi:hypothetical protein